ncbi:MAG: translation initiation factor IF-2 [Candidatus Aminicenantales bacterium]
MKEKKTTKKVKAAKEIKTAKEEPKIPLAVRMKEGSTLKNLADKVNSQPKDVLKKLRAKGFELSVNSLLNDALAAQISQVMGVEIQLISVEKEMKLQAESQKENLVPRPPVVTIMGHVDHGKTTLLDAIRASKLVEKEYGGITQHIGAYQVFHNKRGITFIDTPGHEAFTQLRARGARVTDIVVLVVAADEGVMPQTKEAINHAKAAGVPIIVAINKIDKPEANSDRVKHQLQKEGLLVEEWSGDVISIDLSAKERKNIKELLDMILLLADVIEIKANPKVPTHGVVLESRLDAKKGPLATVIIQHGTLSVGEAFISGICHGKVRALIDENGKILKSAVPSTPVEILGFSDVPMAGDFFQVVKNIEEAKSIVGFRLSQVRKEEAKRPTAITLDDLFRKIDGGEIKELPLIVKADVQGSIDVLKDFLPSLSTEKVKIKMIHLATGNINESDILLASTTNAIIIGYNVKPAPRIQELAEKENVEIRSYRVIYQLTDDIKKAVSGLLEPVIKETYLGRADVRRIFRIPKVGVIAGCLVTDGKINRNSDIRVIRNKEIVHKGRISSLKHLKENVSEIKKDHECGIGLEKFRDIQEGDIIEAFLTEKIKPES